MMKMRKTNQCLKGKIDQADNEEVNNIFIVNTRVRDKFCSKERELV